MRNDQIVASCRAKSCSHKRCSVSTSSALDRSSHTRNAACRMNMRAAAARCLWPPDSLTPLGPTTVSSPFSSCTKSVSSTAARTAWATSSSPASRPSKIFSRNDSLNRLGGDADEQERQTLKELQRSAGQRRVQESAHSQKVDQLEEDIDAEERQTSLHATIWITIARRLMRRPRRMPPVAWSGFRQRYCPC